MIPICPPSEKTILCFDDDDAILRFERALSKGLATEFSRQRRRKDSGLWERACDTVLLDWQMPGDERTRSCRWNKAHETGLGDQPALPERSTYAGLGLRRGCVFAEEGSHELICRPRIIVSSHDHTSFELQRFVEKRPLDHSLSPKGERIRFSDGTQPRQPRSWSHSCVVSRCRSMGKPADLSAHLACERLSSLAVNNFRELRWWCCTRMQVRWILQARRAQDRRSSTFGGVEDAHQRLS